MVGMRFQSPKHNFLRKGQGEVAEDGLLEIERNAYYPGPTGNQVHCSLARTKIIRGGLGSGKSRCATEVVWDVLLRYPGAMAVIGRRDLTSLKETTQKEFLDKVVDPQMVEGFNVNDNKLYLKNSSACLFRETKDPDKFKSLELAVYLLDEADENPDKDVWFKLDQRLRQTWDYFEGYDPAIWYLNDKGRLEPTYQGLLVFNPTDEEHWLYHLAQRTDIDVEDFRFDTNENAPNLPESYIPSLIQSLPPWEVNRLVHGHWGRQIRGKPVIDGFTMEKNVRTIQVSDRWPLMRAWDFGFKHPCVSFFQIDPYTGRFFKIRELLGTDVMLKDFVPEVRKMTREIVGGGFPVLDFGDPHGADKKDDGLPSVEYLRQHERIHVKYRRERTNVGIDEIQHKVASLDLVEKGEDKKESLFLVDHSCRITIAAYMGGYARGLDGLPVKDGYYDHVVDTDRYGIINNMNAGLAARLRNKKRYQPRNLATGY